MSDTDDEQPSTDFEYKTTEEETLEWFFVAGYKQDKLVQHKDLLLVPLKGGRHYWRVCRALDDYTYEVLDTIDVRAFISFKELKEVLDCYVLFDDAFDNGHHIHNYKRN